MKNVLFISAALEMSDSSAAIRNRKLVKALAQSFQVDSIEFSPRNAEKMCELPNISNIVLKMPFSFQNSSKKKGKSYGQLNKIKDRLKYYTKSIVPDSYAANYRHMVTSIDNNAPDKKYQIVIISSDPKGVHFLWFSSFVKKLINNGAKTYQYWGDPWAGDIASYNNTLTKVLEKRIYSKSKYIIFNSKGTFLEKSEGSPHKEKFLFLSRGLDCDVTSFPEEDSIKLEGKIRFIYAGDFHSRFRNLNPFCEAIKNSPHELAIVGNGDLKEDYHALDNISIKKRMPYKEVSQLVESGDVLLVLLNNIGNQIPGKIYDLASKNKPVMLLYENEKILDFIPFSSRFILVKNVESEIENVISKISNSNIIIDYKELKKENYQEKVLEIFDSGKS
ncbi:hypothetical protein [Pistricoccus aurantiacus]|uniref:hypothetical protein n=1 Tax=Pistricoccus aurantiacus TaxID=1883414 RepID=UPI00363E22AC